MSGEETKAVQIATLKEVARYLHEQARLEFVTADYLAGQHADGVRAGAKAWRKAGNDVEDMAKHLENMNAAEGVT